METPYIMHQTIETLKKNKIQSIVIHTEEKVAIFAMP